MVFARVNSRFSVLSPHLPAYNNTNNATIPTRGNNKDRDVDRERELLVEVPASIEYTLLNDISDELKQFVSFTSATSLGSANVMSTQLNKLAPCTAVSTTWMVALSPALTVVLAGRGTCGRQKVPGYGFLEGPTIWKTGTIGKDMLGGPPPGPSVPKPMFI